MKKIVYILLILLVAAAMVFGRESETDAQKSMVVRSADPQLSAQSLESAAGIISARLKSFGLEGAEVYPVPGKKEIRVVVKDNRDYNYAVKLVCRKGRLEFCETLNYRAVASMLDAPELLSLLHAKVPSPNSSELACTSPADASGADGFLKKAGLQGECRFLWNDLFEDPQVCLYAIKVTDGRGAVLSGSDVESMTVGKDDAGNPSWINIQFRGSVNGQWAEITRRNIGHAIAIVLDGQVVCAPVVQVEISGGKSQISGKFTSAQLKYLAAIAGNGELPAAFEPVE